MPKQFEKQSTESKMSRGGARPGAGRKPGVVSKATADIKTAALTHAESALATLASVMQGDEHPAAARVSAANAILDRAYGKPKQALDIDAKVDATVTEVRRTIVDPRNTNS